MIVSGTVATTFLSSWNLWGIMSSTPIRADVIQPWYDDHGAEADDQIGGA
jgi:hypothetical protein